MSGGPQQGGSLQGDQAGLLPPSGRTARIRAGPAVAHGHSGRDGRRANPGRSAGGGLVGQPRPLASRRPAQAGTLLAQCAQSWQQQRVIRLLDRGYAGVPFLEELTQHQLRFICAGRPAIVWWLPRARSAFQADLPGQTLPGPPHDLGLQLPTVPQYGSASAGRPHQYPSPVGSSPMAGGLQARARDEHPGTC